MALRRALYAGTFDPLTNGHVDIINRSLNLVDELTLLFAVGPSKKPLFALAERMEMAQEYFSGEKRVTIASWDGLLVNYLDQNKMNVIVRGLRPTGDFEYEYQMAVMNRHLSPGIDTIFLVTAPENSFISSTLVKEIFLHGGDVEDLVPKQVLHRMQQSKK